MRDEVAARAVPASMALAFSTIQQFSTVGTTFAGLDISVLLLGYVVVLIALTLQPSHLLHQLALPLSVLATWGRAEGFATLAHGGTTNVWGTAALFGAVGVFMLTWHLGQMEAEIE